MKRSLLAVACLLTFGSLLSAQSLVDVAKKEKERRKKVETNQTHSFDERDLKSAGPRAGTTPGSATQAGSTAEGATATATASAATTAPAQEDPTKTQAYWRDRATAINKKIQDLEARLNGPEMTANTRGAAERAKVEKDLNQARGDRDALVEEVRRKGVPPGWVR